MKRIISITLLFFIIYACDFSKSVNKDLITGLTTAGDGLSCEDVYLSDGENKIQKNTFTYGETFYLNFNDIKGFNKMGKSVFPGMKLTVLSETGDTVMKNDDMYANYTEGMDFSPLLLQATILATRPIYSNKKYKLLVNIWDKKGKGKFKAKMNFNIVPNKHITIESKGVTFDEVYLFAPKRKATIVDDKAKFNEDIYIIFEGLDGFQVDDGKVKIGLSVKAQDAAGRPVLNESDLMGDTESEYANFKAQVYAKFIFLSEEIENPVNCEVVIWDKKSENKIKASVDLNLE